MMAEKRSPENPVVLDEPIQDQSGQELASIRLRPITLGDELAVLRSSSGEVIELAGLLTALAKVIQEQGPEVLRQRLTPQAEDPNPVREGLLLLSEILRYLDKHGAGVLEDLKDAAQVHDQVDEELLWMTRLTGLDEETLEKILRDDYRKMQAVLGDFLGQGRAGQVTGDSGPQS